MHIHDAHQFMKYKRQLPHTLFRMLHIDPYLVQNLCGLFLSYVYCSKRFTKRVNGRSPFYYWYTSRFYCFTASLKRPSHVPCTHVKGIETVLQNFDSLNICTLNFQESNVQIEFKRRSNVIISEIKEEMLLVFQVFVFIAFSTLFDVVL